MAGPISPPPAIGARGRDLPAYVSNGLIGLRVRENPLQAGMALVSGFVGEDPRRGVHAIAPAPYPLAGDLAVGGVWMSDRASEVELVDQRYDFACGELHTRFAYRGERRIEVEAVTFASRSHPTIVCQELTVTSDETLELGWRAGVVITNITGSMDRRRHDTPGEDAPVCDGVMLWSSHAGLSTCGIAYATEAPGGEAPRFTPHDFSPLYTERVIRLRAGRPTRLRQIVSMVPSQLHQQPDFQAVRLVARAQDIGFDALRRENHACWTELWKSRIRLIGAEDRWQALADAAFFYLNASTHAASPSSTSIYGLATWHDYHYYFGHVMWDIDAFGVAPLTVIQPDAARALLDFRSRGLPAARDNARLYGRPGAQFPWEAAPLTGQEATPGGASSAWREDHVNLHVARAFAQFSDITGDSRFLADKAWPVLADVADWIAGRATPRRDGGFDILHLGGPAERPEAIDNDALTIMASAIVLRHAVEAARRLGHETPPRWSRLADGLQPPLRSDGAIAAHASYRKTEEKAATPSPLMGFFPYWWDAPEARLQRTMQFYLDQWRDYVGAPMLSALYGVWAAWTGERDLSLKLLEEGYGAYDYGRFHQTLEYRLDHVPDGVASGPFFANIAGFLNSLIFGFTGLRTGSGPVTEWPARPVILPRGWEAIEIDRLWLRGAPTSLVARHGAERTLLRETKT